MVIKITVTSTSYDFELRSGEHFLAAASHSGDNSGGHFGTCGASDKMWKIHNQVEYHVRELHKLIKRKSPKRRGRGKTGVQG